MNMFIHVLLQYVCEIWKVRLKQLLRGVGVDFCELGRLSVMGFLNLGRVFVLYDKS